MAGQSSLTHNYHPVSSSDANKKTQWGKTLKEYLSSIDIFAMAFLQIYQGQMV